MPKNVMTAENLEIKIRNNSGKTLTLEEQKKLAAEMLEIRVSELQSEGISRQEAIKQACSEIAKDFETLKTEEKEAQTEFLNTVKAELEKQVEPESTAETEASRKKKLADEKEEEEKRKKAAEEKSTPTKADLGIPQIIVSSAGSKTAEAAIQSAPAGATVYLHVNTHSVSIHWHNEAPEEFGKSNNKITLDYDGLKLTRYDMGLHAESRLELPPNATAEQKEKFIAIAKKTQDEIQKQAAKGYSLFSNNCQTASSTLGNIVDPNIQVCSMPPNAKQQFKNQYEAQQKKKQPAKADGAITDAFGTRRTPETPAPKLEANDPNRPSTPKPLWAAGG
jgi:hypothetical protein